MVRWLFFFEFSIIFMNLLIWVKQIHTINITSLN